MMDKSAAQQHTQAVISNRDSLQTELAALKKVNGCVCVFLCSVVDRS